MAPVALRSRQSGIGVEEVKLSNVPRRLSALAHSESAVLSHRWTRVARDALLAAALLTALTFLSFDSGPWRNLDEVLLVTPDIVREKTEPPPSNLAEVGSTQAGKWQPTITQHKEHEPVDVKTEPEVRSTQAGKWQPMIRQHKEHKLIEVNTESEVRSTQAGEWQPTITQHTQCVPEPWWTTADPCASVENLNQFFKESNSTAFSIKHPACPDSTSHQVHVAVPYYNLPKGTLKAAIDSIKQQQYPKVHIYIYDDGSDREDALETLHHVCRDSCNTYNVLGFLPPNASEKLGSEHVDLLQRTVTPQIHSLDQSLHCFRSSAHLGPAGAKYWLFQLIRQAAGANDVIMVVDGDDELMGTDAIKIINQAYVDNAAWATYGSPSGKWEEQTKDIAPEIRANKMPFEPRKQAWIYGHPRTFKAHLLEHVSMADFQFIDGTWLRKATDRAFVYRVIELAGHDRVAYIDKKIYKYKYSQTASSNAMTPKKVKQAHTQHTMDLGPSQRLELPIHVVLMAWKRMHLLPYQLHWIDDQEKLGGRPIYLHIINDNHEEKDLLESIVANYTVGGKCIRQIHVVHTNPDEHLHIFARFMYIEKLRRSTALDYILFFDDDQYLPPSIVATLVKEHQPKGMTTWYGKVFDRKVSGVPAHYWKQITKYDELLFGRAWPRVSYFKYGAPCGSIYDSNLWLQETQLLRIAADLHRWSKIDDLWVSYVMDALLGWQIRRLSPPMVPIDIGLGNHIPKKLVASKHLSDVTMLQKTVSRETKKVATYLDRSVDKVAMFNELQSSFHWDAYATKNEEQATKTK